MSTAPPIEATRIASEAVAPGYNDYVTDHNLGLGRTVLERLPVSPGIAENPIHIATGARS